MAVSGQTVSSYLLQIDDGSEGDIGAPLLLEDSKSGHTSIRKDFTTIDWFFEKFKNKRIQKAIVARNKQRGWKGKLINYVTSWQGLLVLVTVGILTSITAWILHMLNQWIVSVKLGYCKSGWWISNSLCCIEQPGMCSDWVSWASAMSGDSLEGTGAYVLNFFVYAFIATSCAGLGSWITFTYCKLAAGSGIPEVKTILGGFIIKRFLGIRTLFIKSMGLVLQIGSTLPLGVQGPFVHIACCWANIIARKFDKYARSEVKKRQILSAAAAAGVAVAFGAPLGGVLLSMESLSSYFPPKTMWRSFCCAISAVLFLAFLDPFLNGKMTQFAPNSHHSWNWFEIFPFALLGIVGGLLGALLIKLNLRVQRFRRRNRFLKAHPVLDVCALALLASCTNFFNVFSRGSSTHLLAVLFDSCDAKAPPVLLDDVTQALCSDSARTSILLLLLAAVVRLVLVLLSAGAMIPGGLFVPSLVVGACVGRATGWLIQLWQQDVGNVDLFEICRGQSQCIYPAVYAIVGASSMLGGVTRMTVSLAVIMFELTGGLDYIVPIMISVVFSRYVADLFGRNGIFTELIALNGYPYIGPGMEFDNDCPISDVMKTSLTVLADYELSLQQIRDLLDAHKYHGFPIVNNSQDKVISGYISRADLEQAIETLLKAKTGGTAAHATHGSTFGGGSGSGSGGGGAPPLASGDTHHLALARVHFTANPPPFATPNALDLSGCVDHFPVVVHTNCPADRVMDQFKSLGLRYVLVGSERGVLQGLVKKKDMLQFIHGIV